MAKKHSKPAKPVFLIIDDRTQCSDLAEGVRDAGYSVSEYQTGREFLIDKRNHTGGIVLAEFRLLGMQGDELAAVLAGERHTFPIVLLASQHHAPRAVKAGVDFIVRTPTVQKLLEAIQRIETPESFDAKKLRWGFENLSQTETRVLDGVLAGLGSRDIAVELGVSSKTIEAHRARINAKTRARDVGELVRMWKAFQVME
jgi:two-component system response regulator FixJ